MRYIFQLLIIMIITFAGEVLHYFIPLPIPASIYGLVLMLAMLCMRVIKIEKIEKTADFLLEIMPLMFIPGGVGLVTAWADLKPVIVPVTVIMLVTTVLVIAVTGKTAELVMFIDSKIRKRGGKDDE